MRRVVVAAGRRGLAAFVLVVAGWIAGWLVAFRVGHPGSLGPKAYPPAILAELLASRCAVGSDNCYAVSPGWTIPAAIATALLGVATAAILYGGRPNWPRHPRVKPPQAGVFELPPL